MRLQEKSTIQGSKSKVKYNYVSIAFEFKRLKCLIKKAETAFTIKKTRQHK